VAKGYVRKYLKYFVAIVEVPLAAKSLAIAGPAWHAHAIPDVAADQPSDARW
jgi:hypothetical protein